MIVIGDSLTAASWPDTVQRLSPMLEIIQNAGVGGQTCAKISDRLDKDALRYQPDVVVIWAGANDIGIQPNDAIASCLRSMVDRTKAAGIKAVLVNYPPINHLHVDCRPRIG